MHLIRPIPESSPQSKVEGLFIDEAILDRVAEVARSNDADRPNIWQVQRVILALVREGYCVLEQHPDQR